jgi:hypothetical protein
MENEFKLDDDIVKIDEKMVFNPYNPLNVEITLNDVQSILSKYGIPPIVNNIELYKRAFVHTSYLKRPQFENKTHNVIIVDKPNDCLPLKSKSNERLEFLGDGVLELITKFYLYRRFPKQEPGFMTDKKIAIVKNEAIGKIAYEMQLNKWLILSKHAEEKKIRTNLKRLGCLFEAFLGAFFLDFNKITVNDEEGWFRYCFVTGPGFQMAQKFIENVFETHIDWISLIQNNDNYKNLLQVKIQKKYKITPSYVEINHCQENGYNMGTYLCINQPIYNTNIKNAVSINMFHSFEDIDEYLAKHEEKALIFMGHGVHKIKRKAEQQACFNALEIIDAWTMKS